MSREERREKAYGEFQDFACRISDIIWGGELGWDRPGGLEALAQEVLRRERERRILKAEATGLLEPASSRSGSEVTEGLG